MCVAISTTACDRGVLLSGSVLTKADSTYPAALEGTWVDSANGVAFHINAVEHRLTPDRPYRRWGYLVSASYPTEAVGWIGGVGVAQVGPQRYLLELSAREANSLWFDARFVVGGRLVPGKNTRLPDPREAGKVASLAATFISARIPLLCLDSTTSLRCSSLEEDSVLALLRRPSGGVRGVQVKRSAILDGSSLTTRQLTTLFSRPGFSKELLVLRRAQ
jgi:hypothetical protein